MMDLGNARQFLGLQISRNRSIQRLHICQSMYLNAVLRHFHMADCNGISIPMDPSNNLWAADSEATPCNLQLYQAIVESLMYSMIGTRPNLGYSISTLSQFNANPATAHHGAAKRALQYTQSTTDYGINYETPYDS